MHPLLNGRQRIVDDLIPIILDCGNWWSRDYTHLAAVSRAWLWHVQKRLYALPQLTSYRSCALLERTLECNPALASLVEGLDLRLVAGETTLTFCDTSSVRRLLSVLKLKRLGLRGEMSIHAERFLRPLMYPHQLEELIIDGYSHGYHGASTIYCSRKSASLVWDSELFSQFTRLRRVRLSYVELTIHRSTLPDSLHLTHLSLDNVTIVDSHLSNISLMSSGSLRCLSISARDDVDLQTHLPSLLGSCSSSLEELCLYAWGANCKGLVFNSDAPSFPSLVEIELNGIDTDRHTLACIEQCCPKLERLSVSGRAVHVTPQEWIAFLGSGALPTLRSFSPVCAGQHGSRAWTEEYLKQVQDICSLRTLQTRG